MFDIQMGPPFSRGSMGLAKKYIKTIHDIRLLVKVYDVRLKRSVYDLDVVPYSCGHIQFTIAVWKN
jgi:hypothetical protein